MQIGKLTVSPRELQRNYKKVIQLAQKSNEPVYLVIKGKAEAALVGDLHLGTIQERIEEELWDTIEALDTLKKEENSLLPLDAINTHFIYVNTTSKFRTELEKIPSQKRAIILRHIQRTFNEHLGLKSKCYQLTGKLKDLWVLPLVDNHKLIFKLEPITNAVLINIGEHIIYDKEVR